MIQKLNEIDLIPKPIEYSIRGDGGFGLNVKGTPFGRYFALRFCDGTFVVDHWPSGFRAGAFEEKKVAISFATFLSIIDDFNNSDQKEIQAKSKETYKIYKNKFDYYKELRKNANTFDVGSPVQIGQDD